MKITREWGLKIGIVALALFWLSLMAASWADAASEPASPEGAREPASDSSAFTPLVDDEYNFNWLDPEKKIYVLQNRRYRKANRIMFSLLTGPSFSNAYRESFNLDPRVAYYLSEAWGFEVFYTLVRNWSNSTANQLSAAAGGNNTLLPVIREIDSQYGGEIHWVPWYAKINVFNHILYFDWYFAAGAGAIDSNVYNSLASGALDTSATPQTLFSMFFGTGHIYHLTDSLLVRFDFTSAVYNAPVFGTSGNNSWFTNTNFELGVGVRL